MFCFILYVRTWYIIKSLVLSWIFLTFWWLISYNIILDLLETGFHNLFIIIILWSIWSQFPEVTDHRYFSFTFTFRMYHLATIDNSRIQGQRTKRLSTTRTNKSLHRYYVHRLPDNKWKVNKNYGCKITYALNSSMILRILCKIFRISWWARLHDFP